MTTTINDLRPAHPDGESPFGSVRHPARRAYLEALAISGSRTEAAKAAGVHRCTAYSPAWKNDAAFQEGLELAEAISADALVAEAVRRARDGVRQPVFDKRSGTPLKHPDRCDCGHDRREWHVKKPRPGGETEGPLVTWGACSHPECDCSTFVGAPVYELTFSDRLLKFLLQARDPETFGDKLQVQGMVAKLDFSQLPDVALDRISKGENAQAVLASLLEAGGEDADAVRKALPEGSKVGQRHRAGGQTGELVQDRDKRESAPPLSDADPNPDPDLPEEL